MVIAPHCSMYTTSEFYRNQFLSMSTVTQLYQTPVYYIDKLSKKIFMNSYRIILFEVELLEFGDNVK